VVFKFGKQDGFTFIELMVVVVVIGILASMTIPPYQDYTIRTRLSEVFSLTEPVREAVKDYYANTGRLPENNLAAGLVEPDLLTGHRVTALTLSKGVIHIRVQVQHKENTLSLRPELPNNVVVRSDMVGWVCGYAKATKGMHAVGENLTDIENHFLPTVCKHPY
jgi:type IV pilus assembly protein PilA